MSQVWKMVTLGDAFSSITNGVNCDQKSNSGNHMVTRIETISKGVINLDRIGRANLSEKDLIKYRLSRNDILFSHINSPIHVGKTALFEIEDEVYHGVNLLRIRTIDEVNPKFLRYFFLELYTSGFWRTVAKQSVNQASVNQKDISSVPFSYPSLEKQKEIVEKLDSAFAEIDQIEENLKQRDAIIGDLFQSLLTSSLTEGKNDDLAIKKLGELCTITSSKRIFKSEYVEQGIPFYRSKEIKELASDKPIKVELFISIERYQEIKSKFSVPSKGDILMTAVGTIGEILVVDGKSDFYFKDGNIVWLKDLNGIDSNYMALVLKSMVEVFNSTAQGSAYSALTIEKIKTFRIAVPELAVQKNIVEKLNNVFAEIVFLKEKTNIAREFIAAFRQSLLSSAFTPETDEEAT